MEMQPPRLKRSPTTAKEPFRVAVLIETSTSWGRRVIEGVIDYSRTHGPWTLYVEPKGIDEAESVPRSWKGDGVIARVRTPGFANRLRKLGVPVVNVSGIVDPKIDFPKVYTEEKLIAEMAVNNLASRGFVHFAYCGIAARSYVVERAHVFEEVVRTAGYDCHVYFMPTEQPKRERRGMTEQCARWLASLPRPVAVATFSAVHGRRVCEAAEIANLLVPDDVAIITVDTDDLIGELIHPPLSAVQLATERLGYEAAQLLHQMLQGQKVPQLTAIAPLGIAERLSTDVLAIDDPDVRNALRFIKDNANRPISVTDVMSTVSTSRRVLERRFRMLLQRTPAQEIRRIHIERAKQLLAHTNLAIPDVAHASGFNYVEHMIPLFRKTFGMTPLVFRRQMQSSS